MAKRALNRLSLPARTGIVVALGAVFALIICLAFALAALCSDDPTANLTLYGEICFGLTMLFCGFVGAKVGGEKRLFDGMLSGVTMLMITVILSLFSSSGDFMKSVIIAVLGLIISAVGAALGSREPKRKRRR